MAGRHAGPAVMHHLRRLPFAEDLQKLGAQRLRILERRVRLQIVAIEAVARSGDVSRHRVDRLLLAAVARGRARIEQHHPLAFLLYVCCVDRAGAGGAHGILRRRKARHFRGNGALLGEPFRQPAVEHRDGFVPDPAQHPPQPRRHGAVGRVVAHHLVLRQQPGFPDPLQEIA